MSEMSRLRWQCRRGMRELDILTVRYLEARFAAAPDDEKAAFRALLALPDPELAAYLLKGQRPADAALAHVVARILSLPHI